MLCTKQATRSLNKSDKHRQIPKYSNENQAVCMGMVHYVQKIEHTSLWSNGSEREALLIAEILEIKGLISLHQINGWLEKFKKQHNICNDDKRRGR